jgi:TnpA family transposase
LAQALGDRKLSATPPASRRIDTQIIEDNWDDILRFIATIKLKETTASEIFRRLNSYSKQHTLYRALKTFGKIIKSIFILRYIDDLELRQAIEKQLNKIENSQQFSRAVSIGNPREFPQADKQEQEVAEGCKRLIKNAITCWNYLYLSQKISETMGQKPGRSYSRQSQTARSCHGSILTCWANTTSRTKSFRIRSGSSPQN